jgi:hypothetical protein
MAGSPCTAADIYHVLNVESGIGPNESVKLSSLSGTLKKMYDAGELLRVDGWGPRGGYGYLVNHA